MNIFPLRGVDYTANHNISGYAEKYSTNSLKIRPKQYLNQNAAQNFQLPDTLSFLGTYYAVTDSHSRLPMTASTLSEIENRCKENRNNEPVFLLDCGDFSGDTYSLKSVGDVYSKFQKRNPKITCVFNLGNYDIDPLFNTGALLGQKDEVKNTLQKMSDSGINIVSASYCRSIKDFKKEGKPFEKLNCIKPYVVLNDITDGKNSKVFVTGITTDNRVSIEEEIKALDFVKEIYTKDNINADKVILLIHNKVKDLNKLLDYAEKTLKIQNIELVIGGHPHSINDYKMGKTRILYPPAQGKGAYQIKSREDGFEFNEIKLRKSGYDYSPLKNHKSIIDNSDINNPYPINPAYKKILYDAANSKYSETIVEESPYTLEFRHYDKDFSAPTTFGTFIANSYRDFAGTDIALSRNQFLREKLPSKGNPVNQYNICDSINVDANLYKADISISKLKEILEISFKDQDRGLASPSFLEYSDNLRVTRKKYPKNNEDIVRQIEIYKDGKWEKLLDENSVPIDDRTISVTSEDAVICSQLNQYSNLNIEAERLNGFTMRNILVKALQNEKPDMKEPFYHTSQIIDV